MATMVGVNLWACDASSPDLVRGRFAFPLADPARISEVVGLDHDPDVYESTALQAICLDHAGRGFPHCYDEHDGTDFLLEGGFDAMDGGSLAVLAAAPGRVSDVRDGNYDRCHATLQGVDCDGYAMVANRVVVDHDSGWRTWYLHLKSGSVVVSVGQRVERGEVLGLVGSSGRSSLPHLHFEVSSPAGVVTDPYSGVLSQPTSLWCQQEAERGLPGSCWP